MSLATDVLVHLGAAWASAAFLQLVLWLISLRTRNAAIVDVGWAASFTVAVGVFWIVAALRGHGVHDGAVGMTVMVAAWSLRLASYLVSRGAASGEEEGRYVKLRKAWAPHAARAFFVFFQAQALLTGVLAAAFVLPFVVPAPGGVGTALRIAGAAVWVVGLIGESLADQQLAAFKRDPDNRGQVCDVGLWGLSRHPNYFFECLVWCGFALYSLPYPAGALALLGPAIITASILRVTGIPATEAQAVRSKGDLYRDYQRRVSAFVPWFPRGPRP